MIFFMVPYQINTYPRINIQLLLVINLQNSVFNAEKSARKYKNSNSESFDNLQSFGLNPVLKNCLQDYE